MVDRQLSLPQKFNIVTYLLMLLICFFENIRVFWRWGKQWRFVHVLPGGMLFFVLLEATVFAIWRHFTLRARSNRLGFDIWFWMLFNPKVWGWNLWYSLTVASFRLLRVERFDGIVVNIILIETVLGVKRLHTISSSSYVSESRGNDVVFNLFSKVFSPRCRWLLVHI